jgi:hypothetical protein
MALKKRCSKAGCKEYAKIPAPNLKAFCSLDCMVWKATNNLDKIKKAEIKADNSKRIEDKKRFNENDIQWNHRTCTLAFNRSRVMQELKWFEDNNLEPSCISCGKENMDWCCGHYKTVGSSGGIRYDRKNTYLQCNRYCNKGLSGNISGNKSTRGYIQGLKERFGHAEGSAIIEYCKTQQHVPKKWTCEEIREIKETSLRIQKMLRVT